jgi:hypothetical protein
VKQDQDSFARVIELMRHITLRGDNSESQSDLIATTKSELLPLPNIAFLKQ